MKSTAYGSISLLITIGAAVLLGLLFLRRLVNFVLAPPARGRGDRPRRPRGRHRRAAAEPEPGVTAGPEDGHPVAEEPAVGDLPAPDDGVEPRPHRMPPPPPPRPAREKRTDPRAPAAALPRGAPAVGTVRRPRAGLLPAAGTPAAATAAAAARTSAGTAAAGVPQPLGAGRRRHPGDVVAAAGPAGSGGRDARRRSSAREGAPGASRSILRAAGTMAVATLVSRITGLLRTMVLAAALGVVLVNDAYNTANTLPNIVYELLLGGVLTSVVVPLLVHAQERDRDGGVGYAQRLATIATAGLVVVTGVAILVAPLLTSLYGITDDPDQVRLANWLARILLVEIVFYGVGRPGPGDPQLPGRLRPAGVGAGAQQRRRHRHRPAVHRRERSGRPRARDDHPRPGLAARRSAPRSASPSRRSSCCRC